MARRNWYSDHPPSCTCWRCNEGRRRGEDRSSGESGGRWWVFLGVILLILIGCAVWLAVDADSRGRIDGWRDELRAARTDAPPFEEPEPAARRFAER